MLLSDLAHYSKLDWVLAAAIVTFDCLCEGKHGVKAEDIYVAGEKDLFSLWAAVGLVCDEFASHAVVRNQPTPPEDFFVMCGHFTRNGEAHVRTIDNFAEQALPPARKRKPVRLVMALPVVHHVNDEIQFRVLLMQCKCGRQDPWSNRYDE